MQWSTDIFIKHSCWGYKSFVIGNVPVMQSRPQPLRPRPYLKFRGETETSSKTSRPRLETSKFVHFVEFKKNVVNTSDLIFFKFLAFFWSVLIVSYLQIQQRNSLNYRNFNKTFLCNTQSLETWSLRDRDETWSLRDRDETWSLRGRDSQKWVPRGVSRLHHWNVPLYTFLSSWSYRL